MTTCLLGKSHHPRPDNARDCPFMGVQRRMNSGFVVPSQPTLRTSRASRTAVDGSDIGVMRASNYPKPGLTASSTLKMENSSG